METSLRLVRNCVGAIQLTLEALRSEARGKSTCAEQLRKHERRLRSIVRVRPSVFWLQSSWNPDYCAFSETNRRIGSEIQTRIAGMAEGGGTDNGK